MFLNLCNNMSAHACGITVTEGLRDNSIPNLCGALPRWEKVLEYLHYAQPKLRGEAVEDQVWVAFAHGSARAVGNICAQDHVMQGEAGCGTMREMRHGSVVLVSLMTNMQSHRM
jgi:hypothetical protein